MAFGGGYIVEVSIVGISIVEKAMNAYT